MEKKVLYGEVRLRDGVISFIGDAGEFMCFKSPDKQVFDRINSLSDFMLEFGKWDTKVNKGIAEHRHIWLKDHGLKESQQDVDELLDSLKVLAKIYAFLFLLFSGVIIAPILSIAKLIFNAYYKFYYWLFDWIYFIIIGTSNPNTKPFQKENHAKD